MVMDMILWVDKITSVEVGLRPAVCIEIGTGGPVNLVGMKYCNDRYWQSFLMHFSQFTSGNTPARAHGQALP